MKRINNITKNIRILSLLLIFVTSLQVGCGFVYFNDEQNCGKAQEVCQPHCETYCTLFQCWEECYDECTVIEPVCRVNNGVEVTDSKEESETTTEETTTVTTTEKETTVKKDSGRSKDKDKKEKHKDKEEVSQGSAGLCQVCENDGDCYEKGAKCIQINYNRVSKTGEKVCGRACRVNTDCPVSFQCVRISDASNGGAQCIPEVQRVDGKKMRTCGSSVELECVNALECSAGESCVHNRCVSADGFGQE